MRKTSFPQKHPINSRALNAYFCYQIMGCLQVHSKYSLACPWLYTWPGMEEQEYEEEYFGDEHAN
jgi:hypothetical protein